MPGSKRISGTTWEVYLYILTSERSQGVREIWRGLNLSTPSLAQYHVNKLLDLGLIKATSEGKYRVKEGEQMDALRSFIVLRGRLVPRLVFYGTLLLGIFLAYIILWPFRWDFQDFFVLAISLFSISALFFEAYHQHKGLTTILPIFKLKKGGRPQAVTVISVLSTIGGLIASFYGLIVIAWFIQAVQGLGWWTGMFLVYLGLMGTVLFSWGLLSLSGGWGVWKGSKWAWTLVVILGILGIIGGLFSLSIDLGFWMEVRWTWPLVAILNILGVIGVPHGLIRVLVCGLILYYLYKPSVKAWFKKSGKSNEISN